jgi:hypothetical protein
MSFPPLSNCRSKLPDFGSKSTDIDLENLRRSGDFREDLTLWQLKPNNKPINIE